MAKGGRTKTERFGVEAAHCVFLLSFFGIVNVFTVINDISHSSRSSPLCVCVFGNLRCSNRLLIDIFRYFRIF